jgi:hypothetical protein
VLLLATLVTHALWAGTLQITNGDVWWDLATGRWIVEHRQIPTHDVFSYTHAGARWPNQEWASHVLFYELYRRLGGWGLAGWKLLATAATFLVAAWVAWRRSGSAVAAVAATVTAAFLCRPFLDIRPQLFTLLGTVVVLAVLEGYRRGRSLPIFVLLPGLMALWVNLHYGFIFGLGTIVLYATVELLKSLAHLPAAPMEVPCARRLAGAALVAAAACLLSHEGIDALTFPFEILGSGDSVWRQEIIEWQPPVLFAVGAFSPLLFWYVLIGQAVLALAALLCAPRRFDVADALHVAIALAMALSARRFVPLFAVVATPFAARNLATVAGRMGWACVRPGVRAAVGIGCLLVTGQTVAGFIPEARRTFRAGLFDGMVNGAYFPRGAVDFLRRNPLPGRLFHTFVWGGYVMFELPGRKVFIDNRAHAVYPGEFYLESRTAEFGYPGWDRVLDRYDVAVVLWPTGFAGGRHVAMRRELVHSPLWQRIYDDGHSGIFVHVERGASWVARYRAFALDYPELPGAQLFLVDAYIEAGALERARRHLEDVMARFPETADVPRRMEERLLRVGEAGGAPAAVVWLRVALYRDAAGDRAGAAEAYRLALARGLDAATAPFARSALGRLAPAPGP